MEVKDNKIPKTDEEIIEYVENVHTKMKQWKYRVKYDALLREMEEKLVDTGDANDDMVTTSGIVVPKYSIGFTDNGTQFWQKRMTMYSPDAGNKMRSKEPYIYSKIMTATGILAANPPDGVFTSHDPVFARAEHALWKHTWISEGGNAIHTLENFYQSVIGTGFGAYCIFPQKIVQPCKDVVRVIFDDIYRKAINPKDIWLGVGTNNADYFSRGEVLFQTYIPEETFMDDYPDVDMKKVFIEDQMVVVKSYENRKRNVCYMKSGSAVLYKGELLNGEGFNSVVWANAGGSNIDDPYGVGIYELMRNSVQIADELMSMTIEQVANEIRPLLFGANNGNGSNTYRRGGNIINSLPVGGSITQVKTSGNIEDGRQLYQETYQRADKITGITDAMAGVSPAGTLGQTIIAKEAGLTRIAPLRARVVRALVLDAYTTLSFMRQYYSTDDIYSFDTSNKVKDFVESNPGYFMGTPVKKRKEGKTMWSIPISKWFTLDFNAEHSDNEKGEHNVKILEKQKPYRQSRTSIYKDLSGLGHITSDLTIVIDPTSMLIPSQEIRREQVSQLLPTLDGLVTNMFMSAQQSPELAKAKAAQLLWFLKEQEISPYDVYPKELFDSIEDGSLFDPQLQQAQKQQMINDAQPNPNSGTPLASPGGGQPPQSSVQSPLSAGMDSAMGQGGNLMSTASRPQNQ